MKWILEADDFGNIFHTTYPNGVNHRRPINVDDDVSEEPEFIKHAALETWTEEVVAAARDLKAKREREQADENAKIKAAQAEADAAEKKRFDDAVAEAVARLSKKP